jgi:hypothetical protein
MPSKTIYHEDYYLSVDSNEPILILLGLSTVLNPIETLEFIEAFRQMLQNDPSERDWNSRYCYSHGFVDETTGEREIRASLDSQFKRDRLD